MDRIARGCPGRVTPRRIAPARSSYEEQQAVPSRDASRPSYSDIYGNLPPETR